MRRTVVYYGHDGDAAKVYANKLRSGAMNVHLIDCTNFDTPEDCDAAHILPDVPAWRRERIEKGYGELAISLNEAPKPAPAYEPTLIEPDVGPAPALSEPKPNGFSEIDPASGNAPPVKRKRGRPRKTEIPIGT